MFEKQIVIDGKGHLFGRLASVIAKELLSGQKIVVVRCEQIVITGSRELFIYKAKIFEFVLTSFHYFQSFVTRQSGVTSRRSE